MKAEEKAKSLIKQYEIFEWEETISTNSGDYCSTVNEIPFEIAKKCALVTVKEIIDNCLLNFEPDEVAEEATFKYWNEVKQHLLTLNQ